MSLRLEMLQVARLAPKILGESTDLVRPFLLAQQNSDGGFKDRTGRSDLYYTVFGLDALLALPAQPDLGALKRYLDSFGAGEGLDFVHLCCLARCWAALANLETGALSLAEPLRAELMRRIEAFRSLDGGYSPVAGNKTGTAYGCFLGLGAHLDLRVELPQPLAMVQSLKFLETSDGAWANERGVKMGATNSTAAAVTVLRNLQAPINTALVSEWLLSRCHPEGGFLAVPQAPIPDLLSTATALHALSGLQVSMESIREPCLDFVDTLWTNEGAFHGNWTDDHLDCEYAFYGLLALGHLSL